MNYFVILKNKRLNREGAPFMKLFPFYLRSTRLMLHFEVHPSSTEFSDIVKLWLILKRNSLWLILGEKVHLPIMVSTVSTAEIIIVQ